MRQTTIFALIVTLIVGAIALLEHSIPEPRPLISDEERHQWDRYALRAAQLELEFYQRTRVDRIQILEMELRSFGASEQEAAADAESTYESERMELLEAIRELRREVSRQGYSSPD